MPFTGDTFAHLFDWEKDPPRQEKIVNARLEAEFDGVDTGLSAVSARATALEAITAATQAEQETATATNRYVSPGRQHFHPSAAKVWANFGVTGNILKSYNVSSVTDSGTGVATVNFTVAFSEANYAYGGGFVRSAEFMFFQWGNPGTGSQQIVTGDAVTLALEDPDEYAYIAFGDQ